MEKRQYPVTAVAVGTRLPSTLGLLDCASVAFRLRCTTGVGSFMGVIGRPHGVIGSLMGVIVSP